MLNKNSLAVKKCEANQKPHPLIAKDHRYTQELSIHCALLANVTGSAFLEGFLQTL